MTMALPQLGSARAFRPRLDAAQVFAHVVCIACFCLQRFGVPFGGGTIFVSVLVVPPLIIGLLFTRRARVSPSTALLFILMVCCFLGSAIYGVVAPDPRMRFSLLSIIELLLIYSMLTVEPDKSFDSAAVLKVFCFYIRLLSCAAIIQYALQFAHIKVFSFLELLPALGKFSTESGYHVVAVIKYGSPILRANGFFLLEPSILSQMIVVGVVADYFVLGRKTFLPVYAAAVLASYSGTGPLILAVTLVAMGLLSPSQLPRVLGFLLLTAVVVAFAAIVFPAEFSTLAARANGDASAQQRYAGQLDVIRTILNDPRLVFGFGPGAADGYSEGLPGTSSPALKLVFDYGALGLVVFVIFLVKALWRRDKPMLSIVSLVTFQLGGGALLFGPLIFIMALICIWSKPAQASSRAAARVDLRPAQRRAALVA